MKFDELELRAELSQAITDLGHTQPTPIQEQAIPEAIAGRDLMCCARTGTGKTAAFALPILHRLAGQPRAEVRAVILVPTRELAIQVGRSFNEYGRHLDLVTATIFGGVPFEPQEMILRHGADILVATPGRLKDHIWRGHIDFKNTQLLVLDEADRMLDMGFIKIVREIVELMPTERQSMLFSATLDPEIRRFAKGMLKNPMRIDVTPSGSTLDEVDQLLVKTDPGRKPAKLESLIREHHMERTIVFTRTKSGASRLASHLRNRGFNASAIHGDRTQGERVRALEGFRNGEIKILVATDVAARGIDVDDISHVINYDLPFATKDYVHRIGRTARAGRRGVAISLVSPEDRRSIAAIERLIGRKLVWDGIPGGHPLTDRANERDRPSRRSGRRRSTEGSRAAAPDRARRRSRDSLDPGHRDRRDQAREPRVAQDARDEHVDRTASNGGQRSRTTSSSRRSRVESGSSGTRSSQDRRRSPELRDSREGRRSPQQRDSRERPRSPEQRDSRERRRSQEQRGSRDDRTSQTRRASRKVRASSKQQAAQQPGLVRRILRRFLPSNATDNS